MEMCNRFKNGEISWVANQNQKKMFNFFRMKQHNWAHFSLFHSTLIRQLYKINETTHDLTA